MDSGAPRPADRADRVVTFSDIRPDADVAGTSMGALTSGIRVDFGYSQDTASTSTPYHIAFQNLGYRCADDPRQAPLL